MIGSILQFSGSLMLVFLLAFTDTASRIRRAKTVLQPKDTTRQQCIKILFEDYLNRGGAILIIIGFFLSNANPFASWEARFFADTQTKVIFTAVTVIVSIGTARLIATLREKKVRETLNDPENAKGMSIMWSE